MNKFKVGDLVRGMAETRYSITNTKMTKARVTRVLPGEIIEIAILEHDDKWCNGSDTRYPVEARHFELIKKPEARIIKVGQAKFIFNPPYTIVTDGTHTGKAKCNPSEEYDPITGLEIAKKRFEEAKFPDEPKKFHIHDIAASSNPLTEGEYTRHKLTIEEIRRPRVGDKVEITGGWYHNFKIGDIGVVIKNRGVIDSACEVKIGDLEQSIKVEDCKLVEDCNLVEELKVGDRVEMIRTRGFSFDRIGNKGTVLDTRDGFTEVKIDGIRRPKASRGWLYGSSSKCWKKICTK